MLLLGLLLSRFWPYFSPWEVIRGGHGADAGWAGDSLKQLGAELHVKHRLHEFYQLPGLLRAFGLALLALVALPYFLLKRERWFIGLGALAMLLPFVVNAFVDLPLGHRFVLLAMVYLDIGVVWLLLRITPGYPGAVSWLTERRGARIAASLALVALFAVFTAHGVSMAREQLASPKFYTGRESPVVRNMRNFAEVTGPGAVVLSNALLSWPLPTFGPKVLLLFHDDPLVSDETERELYVARFLGRATDEQRRQILAHYGVTHVLLGRESNPALLRFLANHATVRAVGTGYRLYTLDPSAKAP
jgi:hypothetical protein